MISPVELVCNFGMRRLFVLKAPQGTVKKNYSFTFVWHSLVIRLVKIGLHSKKSILLKLFSCGAYKKKCLGVSGDKISCRGMHCLFVLKAPRSTVKKNYNFTFVWHSLVIRLVKLVFI